MIFVDLLSFHLSPIVPLKAGVRRGRWGEVQYHKPIPKWRAIGGILILGFEIPYFFEKLISTYWQELTYLERRIGGIKEGVYLWVVRRQPISGTCYL